MNWPRGLATARCTRLMEVLVYLRKRPLPAEASKASTKKTHQEHACAPPLRHPSRALCEADGLGRSSIAGRHPINGFKAAIDTRVMHTLALALYRVLDGSLIPQTCDAVLTLPRLSTQHRAQAHCECCAVSLVQLVALSALVSQINQASDAVWSFEL